MSTMDSRPVSSDRLKRAYELPLIDPNACSHSSATAWPSLDETPPELAAAVRPSIERNAPRQSYVTAACEISRPTGTGGLSSLATVDRLLGVLQSVREASKRVTCATLRPERAMKCSVIC
jgi:hypothetical protein